MEKANFEQIRQAIRDAMKARHITQLQAARDLQIDQASLSRFLSGKATIQGDSLVKLLSYMGGEVRLPGDGNDKWEDYQFIPKVKARPGAGASHATSDHVTGWYVFRKDFLKREHIHAEECTMMMVVGDSMEPFIREGDTVLVDEADRWPIIPGKIYVLRFEDALMVKKLYTVPGGGLKICSENDERGDMTVSGAEMEQIEIIGRVRWFGRALG